MWMHHAVPQYHHGKLGGVAFRPCWTNVRETRVPGQRTGPASVSMQGDETLSNPLSREQDDLFSCRRANRRAETHTPYCVAANPPGHGRPLLSRHPHRRSAMYRDGLQLKVATLTHRQGMLLDAHRCRRALLVVRLRDWDPVADLTVTAAHQTKREGPRTGDPFCLSTLRASSLLCPHEAAADRSQPRLWGG